MSSSCPALDTAARPVKLDNPVENWTSGSPEYETNKTKSFGTVEI
jgi:hypothetical protein